MKLTESSFTTNYLMGQPHYKGSPQLMDFSKHRIGCNSVLNPLSDNLVW